MKLFILKVTNVLKKIKRKGFLWGACYITHILRSPSYLPLEKVNRFIVMFTPPVVFLSKRKVEKQNSAVLIYDLNFNPATFDFCFVVSYFSSLAICHNAKSLDVIFILENETKFTTNMDASIGVSGNPNVRWRLNNILLPIVECAEIGGNVLICHSYEQAKLISDTYSVCFPKNYNRFFKPVFFYKEAFKQFEYFGSFGFFAPHFATKQFQKFIGLFDKPQKIVSISLRNYGYDEKRNSDLNIWFEISEWLSQKGYSIILIPDTADSFLEKLISENKQTRSAKNIYLCGAASWNLFLRLAIYQNSYFSFVTGGPANLCQLSAEISHVTYSFFVENSEQGTDQMLIERGIEVGQERYSFGTNNHFLAWGKENISGLKKIFLEFEKNNKIRGSE